MIKTKVGFVVYGVHKDGLQDPMGTPFIDEALISRSKSALREAGLELVEYPIIVASRAEARECLAKFKKMDDVSGLVLFSGTWVWAAHLLPALRDYALAGKSLAVWTHPGSQGWRPVGGLVLHGALMEADIPHRFVYGACEESDTIAKLVSYCRAGALRHKLNQAVFGVFGGRGMGQSCGVADPSQWMRTFGIDLDSRDTTQLIRTAEAITAAELKAVRKRIQPLFSVPVPAGEAADRSLRVYLALKKILAAEQWDGYTIQSFPGLGDEYCATCLAQSLMLEDGVGTSTLSDFNTLLSVKLLTEFSRERVYYGDLQHIDKQKKEIKIIGDGACPPSLAGTLGPAGFAEHGIPTEGQAGGISVKLICKPGAGVLARLGRRAGRFELVVCRCTVFEPPAAEIEKRKLECGIPFWPHAFVTAQADMDKLLQAWNNEYACLGYGAHLYDDLCAFGELTGVEVVTP